MQPPLLPYVPKCEQSFGPVYGRIVKYDHGLAPDGHGEVVQKTDHRVGINAFPACEPMGMTTAVNHGEAVEPRSSLRRYVNVFFGKFPAVWHICFLTDMGFISVIKVYGTFVPQPFKLLQLPKLVLVELRRGFTFGRFLMRPNLAPMRLKKRLSVSSQAVFPVAASHCALADNMLERSFSMACRMIPSSCVPIIGLSSCVPIIGLRPRPGGCPTL